MLVPSAAWGLSPASSAAFLLWKGMVLSCFWRVREELAVCTCSCSLALMLQLQGDVAPLDGEVSGLGSAGGSPCWGTCGTSCSFSTSVWWCCLCPICSEPRWQSTKLCLSCETAASEGSLFLHVSSFHKWAVFCNYLLSSKLPSFDSSSTNVL